MTAHNFDRRTFLAATGSTAAVLLAGCTGNDDGNGNGNDNGNGNGNGDDGGGEYLDDEPDYDGWFDGVDHYDGTLDHRDQDTVEVGVGTEGGLAYTPPAVAVSPGTTVVWEWTGDGGDHDVSEVDDAFQSDLTAEAGHTFEHTFEEEGVYRYVCTPHEAVDMKGAIVVQS